MWNRIKFATSAGALILLAVLAIGTGLLLERTERVAHAAAEAALARSAQALENALNRHLLQVDSALASLPTLFAGASLNEPVTPAGAARLLRGFNFQTFAFRDLTLLAPDGAVWATTRARGAARGLPVGLADFGQNREAGSSTVLGPVMNRVTGDWSLYLGRTITVPKAGDLLAVAEVPLPVLMRILSETGIGPGVAIALKRRDGRLIASLPLDEVHAGLVTGDPLDPARLDGVAYSVPAGPQWQTLVVTRPSLYSDIVVEASVPRGDALADWQSYRERTLFAAASAALLITVFATALLTALRQREKAEAERAQASAVLQNALEVMSDGFVMWDQDDRLVTTNQRYRDLYSLSAPFMTKGARFEDIIRRGAEVGQYPEAEGCVEDFVQTAVAWHREGSGTLERLLAGDQWLLVTERRTPDGCTVGIRTDVTMMKAALADLAAANERANEATAEALRQNAVLVERERQISFLAHHDDLTMLPNRVLFRRQIEAALESGTSRGQRVALLYLDLDRFKDVNDTLGHPIGDALLRGVAERLKTCARDGDVVARLGGDEFAIICSSPHQPAQAEALGARIIAELRRPFEVFGHVVTTGVSIGIAVAAESDPDTLLKQADLALYEAKSNGRGKSRVFVHEMSSRLKERLEVEADLRVALSERQLTLAYQPIYDLESNTLSGFEALLRWVHPTRGIVSPAMFVPIAEEMGLITEIGAWVLRQACEDVAALPGDLKIAVNLSPVQIAAGALVSTVRDVLGRTGLPPHRLELEITETALFTSDHRNLEVLRQLHGLGTRIVLDDFGTGYSSLSHLRLYPLDKIKIDRSFVTDMPDDPDSRAIVSALARLAAQLGKITTAEGVETPEQLALVRAAGCTQAQGFLLGKPQPILAAIETVARRRSMAIEALNRTDAGTARLGLEATAA